MTLPEPLRKQLGRLKEQGCPAALVERAMGTHLHFLVPIDANDIRVERSSHTLDIFIGNTTISFGQSGAVFVANQEIEITIPPPKGDA